MKYLKFFDEIESIKLYDDLTQFLGVNEDGVVEITYADIVKAAGHSCATVAGAYLVAREGLKALFKDELPKRGYIKVELKRNPTEDNAGVVASVISIITGATIDMGFGGIPTGKYNRRNLLFFGVDIEADVCFTRVDTGEKVCVNYTPKKIVNPMAILKSAIAPDAKEEDIKSFPHRFQEMVKTVLENSDKVIEIKF
jgi:hypothetical protein